jgi:hypothetical protein
MGKGNEPFTVVGIIEMTSVNLSIDLEEMQRFLQEAKRATFTGNGPRSEIEGIRLYQFSRGAWDYEDRYVGNLLDTGLEVVRFDKFPIWAMSYRGGMLPEAHQRASETFFFLKEALNLVPLETPIRGPKTYSRGDWLYENFLMGELKMTAEKSRNSGITLANFFKCPYMKQLIEAHCKGIFRSYKTIRRSGTIVLHTVQNFQEWDFNDNRILSISVYQHHRRNIVCETDNWVIEFNNKSHFIHIDQPSIQYEIVSVNHTGLVLADSAQGEKIFFARFPVWENLIKKSLPVF